MTKHYKVIFFDWHKTLSRCDFWLQLKDPTHDRHQWHESIVTFLFVENEKIVQQWMRGIVDEEKVLQLVSNKLGYDKEVLRQDLAESCQTMTFLSDKILPLVDTIRKKGIKCVIATDNMDIFKKYVVTALELDQHFDDVLVSFDQQTMKFDVSQDGKSLPFFREYLQKNGLTYSDALLLDDRVDPSGAYMRLGFDMFRVESVEGLLGKLKELSYT